MKNRPRRKRYLVATAHAFIQSSRRNLPIAFSPASGATEAMRPTGLKKPLAAIILTLEFFVERDPTHFSVVWSASINAH